MVKRFITDVLRYADGGVKGDLEQWFIECGWEQRRVDAVVGALRKWARKD